MPTTTPPGWIELRDPEEMREIRAIRRSLDDLWPKMREAAKTLATPQDGWISLIRVSLGMSASELARSLGVAPSTVARLETSERRRSISLVSLARAARSLECDLVYALVPREQLEDTVRNQAQDAARRLGINARLARLVKAGQINKSSALRILQLQVDRLMGAKKLWSK